MVFEKQGFQVFYDNEEFPAELTANRCKALVADMSQKNNMFATKITIELKDCQNKTVFVSEEGVSREKVLSKAYIQAFRTAGKSFSIFKSNPKNVADSQTDNVNVVPNEVPNVTPMAAVSGLYAQPIANGYQLIDTTPKVIMKIYKTSDANIYIAHKDSVLGVMLNKGGNWYFEYYQNEKLVPEKMEVKF
jgi:hypothetical protein